MAWPSAALGVVGFFVHVDAQKDPWTVIFAALAAGLFLWFVVAQARRRDERRARRRDDGEARFR